MPTFKIDVLYAGVWTARIDADNKEAAIAAVQAIIDNPAGDPTALAGYADEMENFPIQARPSVAADEVTPTPDYKLRENAEFPLIFDELPLT